MAGEPPPQAVKRALPSNAQVATPAMTGCQGIGSPNRYLSGLLNGSVVADLDCDCAGGHEADLFVVAVVALADSDRQAGVL